MAKLNVMHFNHSDEFIHRVIDYAADCGGYNTFYQFFFSTSPAELAQALRMITCIATPTCCVVDIKRNKFGNSGLAQT
jgi:hypothetical protein